MDQNREKLLRSVYANREKYGDILAFVPGNVNPPQLETVPPAEGMRISGKIRMPKGLVRGVVRDGVMVAWAAVRGKDAFGVSHITVETDRMHRRKGYAAACLQAVVQEAEGPLLYLCERGNSASAAAARAAGFVLLEEKPRV